MKSKLKDSFFSTHTNLKYILKMIPSITLLVYIKIICEAGICLSLLLRICVTFMCNFSYKESRLKIEISTCTPQREAAATSSSICKATFGSIFWLLPAKAVPLTLNTTLFHFTLGTDQITIIHKPLQKENLKEYLYQAESK